MQHIPLDSYISGVSIELYTTSSISLASAVVVNNLWDVRDPLFGSEILGDKLCPTCKRGKCTGHIGHMLLKSPIFNPLLFQSLKSLLGRVCLRCHKALMTRTKKCRICKVDVVSISCVDIYHDRQDNLLYPTRVVKRLRDIAHANVALLGDKDWEDVVKKHRGEIERVIEESIFLTDSIISFVTVPPKLLRIMDKESKREGHLSTMYKRLCSRVRESFRTHDRDGSEEVYKIYEQILGLTTSNKATSSDSSILDTLSGKQGIFRELMVGKRISHCGRSVIRCDDNLAPDEVLVPSIICDSIRVGKEKRGLRDGDLVMVNRQPSLSKNSMLCMRVRRNNSNSLAIAINSAITKSFGADFDGDEMNIFHQSSYRSMSEQDVLMAVDKNILSQDTGKPEICPVQDAILYAHILTSNVVQISRSLYYDTLVFCNISHKDARIDREIYTTRDLVSLAFPKGFRYSVGDVVIEDGILVSGTLDSRVVKDGDESVLKIITLTLGGKGALEFIHRLQKVSTNASMHYRTVTISYDDICPVEEKSFIQEEIERYQQRAKEMGERDYLTLADNVRKITENKYKELYGGSNMSYLIGSGSKGNITNATQMTVMLGQQYIDGCRPVPPRITNEGIMEDMESRGLCTSSYSQGLSLDEYIVSQMAGREGVVNTNISTASVGYMSRRVAKVCSSLNVGYDGAVHSSTRVLQWSYGKDCMESSCKIGNRVLTKNVLDNVLL